MSKRVETHKYSLTAGGGGSFELHCRSCERVVNLGFGGIRVLTEGDATKTHLLVWGQPGLTMHVVEAATKAKTEQPSNKMLELTEEGKREVEAWKQAQAAPDKLEPALPLNWLDGIDFTGI